MSKKHVSKRQVNPLAQLDGNNNPIPTYAGQLFPMATPNKNRIIGDTGTSSYTGAEYEPSKFDNSDTYVSDLGNLDNIREGNQGIWNSLGNSAAKFLGKTANNVVGGIAGTIYGIGDAAVEGDLSKIWDNSLTTKLDAVDKGLNDIFKVYKSSDYQDQNFLQRMFLHPVQFTDDTADALSFTAGAVLTELATAGVGTELLVPKALKYMKYLSRGAEAAEATANLASTGQKFVRGLGDAAKITKSLATGAAYESSVEARQATMQLRDKLNQEWETNNPGVPMPESVANDIDDRLTKAGLFTYLTNLALVGSSNLVQFPKIFGLGARSSARLAEGAVARNAGTGLYEATAGEAGLGQKILSRLKNPAYEGLVEEGGQNVLSNTAQDFWARKNDPESKRDVSAFVSLFTDNLAKTYTSKEGWNDIGMGLIIGGLGAPGKGILSALGKNNALGKAGYEEIRDENGNVTGHKRANIWEGGVFGADTEANAERQQIQETVDRLNKDTNLFTSMQRNYDTLVRNQSLEKKKDRALQANDLFEFNNAKDDQIHNYVSSRIEAGLSEDLDGTVEDMRKLSPDDFYTSFRGEAESAKKSAGEKAIFQQESIKALENRIANTKSATDLIDGVYKGNNADLREHLIHAVATTKNIDTREAEVNNELSKLSNGVLSNRLERIVDESLRESGTKSIETILNDLSKDAANQTPEVKDFVKQLQSVRNKSLTPTEVNSLLHLAKVSPTDFFYNKDRIVDLLADSRKLRNRRQEYLDLYNSLFTEKGQKDFADFQEKKDKAVADQVSQTIEEEEKKEENKTRAENTKKVVKKAEKAKANTSTTTAITTQEEVPTNVDVTNEEPISNDDIPNVSFDEEGELTQPEATSPVVDNVSTEDTLDAEEEVIVQVEDSKKKKKSKDIEVRNVPEDDDSLEELDYINLDLKRSIGNTITYLGVNKITESVREGNEVYEVTRDKFDEKGNLSINEYVDTKLFSPNYYNPGTKVTLAVPSYTQMQQRGVQNYSEEQYNKDINFVNQFPIAIMNNSNEIIGYLPTQTGIERLVQDEYKDVALKSNINLRSKVFANKALTHSITITQKTPGMVMRNAKSNQQSLFKALGDGKTLANKVSIGIGQNGLIRLNRASNYRNNIINQDSIKSGVVYSIVPSSQQDVYVAVPMTVSQVGLDRGNLIVEAIRLFGNANPDTNQKQSLSNITEYDFTNAKDVNNFVSSILYATSAIDSNDRNYFKLNKSGLILSKTNEDMKYSMDDILNDFIVQEEIAEILSQRYSTVSLENLNSKDSYIGYELKDGVINQIEHSNYQTYLDSNNILTSNINKVNIEGNEYAFTAQPVIALGDTIESKELAIEEVAPVQAESERVTAKSERKTTRKLFDPTKVKPKPLQDVNIEVSDKKEESEEAVQNIIDQILTPEVIEVAKEELDVATEPEVRAIISQEVQAVITNRPSKRTLSDKIKKIVDKIIKLVLGVGIIVNLTLPLTSYTLVKNNTNVITTKTFTQSFDKFDNLTSTGKDVYQQEVKNNKSFILVDKPTATVYVIDSLGQRIADFPAILGMQKGDSANTASTTSTTPGQGATTPSGRFALKNYNHAKDYDNRILQLEAGNGVAIHQTYTKELQKRSAALNSPDVSDNRMSWGCINVSADNWDKYIKDNIQEKSIIVITPDFQATDSHATMPEFLQQQLLKSGEDLKKKCL